MKDDDIDDPLFVAQLCKGDRDAMGRVVSLYLPQTLRAARASGLQAQESEDVVQSAFATFIEKMPEFEGRSRVRTWLFGILYRKVIIQHIEYEGAKHKDTKAPRKPASKRLF